MQALGSAEDGGERLEGGPGHVVVRFLGCEGDARGLGVEAHEQGLLVLRAVPLLHHGRPDAPRGAELGYLLEEVYVRVEEEREPRGEVVDVQPRLDAGLDVGEAVGKGEGELLRRRAPRLADVVSGDGDRVPPWHVLCGVDEYVLEDAHGGLRREEPLLLGYVLLEDVVLV